MGISDRHMRPTSGLAIEAQALRVRICISEEMAASRPGQLLLTCLVNLLCRQVGAVASLELCGLRTPLAVPLPNAGHGDLLDAASVMARWITTEVPVARGDGQGAVDVTLLIGAVTPPGPSDVCLSGVGLGWRAWIGGPAGTPTFARMDFNDPNPMGPFLAASLLSAEVFKRARCATRGRFAEAWSYSLWNGECGQHWQDVADGPRLDSVGLPPFYLVGAGAVGQGLAYILGSAPVSGFLVAIDDDHHDDTNLNRCFLAGADDEHQPKVDCVKRFLTMTGVAVAPFPQTLAGYIGDGHPDLPAPLPAEEAEGRYQVVVSCVDKGVSRQALQGLWPRLILGGSTDGLAAKTNLYDLAEHTACLGCHNPAEPEGELLRTLERQMKGLTRDERAAFLQGRVDDLEAVLNHLDADHPDCGSVGEAQFRSAAIQHGREFSVGFVSLGAALLLAAALLRRLAFGDQAPARGMMATLNFLQVRAADGVLAIDANCMRCTPDRRRRFIVEWYDASPVR